MRPSNRSRGITLIELTVYFGLSVLVAVLLFNFLWSGRRSYEASSQSFLAGTQAETAIQYLRFDLAATTLGSVRVYPNPTAAAEPAGLSMMSARNYDDGAFKISQYGGPLWASNVYYTLRPNRKNQLDLVRWESALAAPSLLPAVSTVMPGAMTQKAHLKVLLHNIAPANFHHKAMKEKLGAAGGFQVSFVRSDTKGELKSERPGETLTVWNPAQVAEGANPGMTFAGNTRMVDVQLTFILPDSSTGKESAVHLPFRVTPRN